LRDASTDKPHVDPSTLRARAAFAPNPVAIVAGPVCEVRPVVAHAMASQDGNVNTPDDGTLNAAETNACERT
jgi:hypothetical protein